MPSIAMINGSPEEMVLRYGSRECSDFKSKDRIVDSNGNIATNPCRRNQYKIIGKHVRQHDISLFCLRVFLGSILFLCTLGTILCNKSGRHLFKRSVSKRFVKLVLPFVGDKIEEKLLFGGTKIPEDRENRQVNFAVFQKYGQLTAVTIKNNREYARYEGSDLDALLLLAQNREGVAARIPYRKYGSPISHFFQSQYQQSITPAQFCAFLLQKDQSGTERICTLNRESTLEALLLLEAHEVKINLHDQTPSGHTLFTLWVGALPEGRHSYDAKNKLKIIEVMLRLDHSVIKQVQGLPQSPFLQHALEGSRKAAKCLLNAMNHEKVCFSPQEVWIARAMNKDSDFSDEEFSELPETLKSRIFFVANAFHRKERVKRLRSLNMVQPPPRLPGLNIFAKNMDIISLREEMEKFLGALRAAGELLTQEEFEGLDTNSKYVITASGDIGQVLGGKFIQRVITENGYTHFKVFRRIAVVLDKRKIPFNLDENLDIQKMPVDIYREQETILRIVPTRQFSEKEATEYIDILAKTGLNDCRLDNLIFTEKGIYFRRHSYKAFNPLGQSSFLIKNIAAKLLSTENAEKIKAAYLESSQKYNKQAYSYDEFFEEHPYTNLLKGVQSDTFSIPFPS
jgi:hypothetical protein